jgi:phospholipid-translocating ATPase
MEMRKLHMGTMSYGFDSMDEVAHQLANAFGADQGAYSHLYHCYSGRLMVMKM